MQIGHMSRFSRSITINVSEGLLSFETRLGFRLFMDPLVDMSLAPRYLRLSIEHPAAIAAHVHEPDVSQDAEMLRDGGLLEARVASISPTGRS
jgi:hypothetical protein